ncbi:class I SAM-dependent methyltransferase [Mucilaginibacter aquaedulcis]|uniref:class I SAM-dependent methyltransferase n=1 Tax=Mucilaginibacter aquaedulcis TaxID=1187081 RepID=UPI0025B55FFA|nr:class I SAM-dependent methyltransferase [Mucilaginibacter aquaedulcis]MDN3547664.1 class I SAM-dependent methyltransferase [Mucilaginibacter aquaedulcis]
MSSEIIEEKSGTIKENITFYNEIATDYDTILDKESSNEEVRKRVEEKFTNTVKSGWVLDFGGGTGRDLDWLVKSNYQVVFCEPSEGMRNKAVENHKNNTTGQIIFLKNDQIDFSQWHIKEPFDIKVDAILSDFAVLNCIGDLELLFKNLAQRVKPGGHFFALMLQHGYKKNWRWKLAEGLRTLVDSKPLLINVTYNNHLQTVYVYTQEQVKNASSSDWDMQESENLYEFTLFHFKRK